MVQLRARQSAPGAPCRPELHRPSAHQSLPACEARITGRFPKTMTGPFSRPRPTGKGHHRAPARHADETPLRVEGKNNCFDIPAAGTRTFKVLRAARAPGRSAYGSVLVHDRWRPPRRRPVRPLHERTRRRMHKQMAGDGHKVAALYDRVLSGKHHMALRKRYRISLIEGQSELPLVPSGKRVLRGRVVQGQADGGRLPQNQRLRPGVLPDLTLSSAHCRTGLQCHVPLRNRHAQRLQLETMNRLLSVVRSRTDKSVELSRALLTSRLSMGNGCAEARLWRGREVLHACRNAGARIDAGSGQGSTWLRKAAMTGSATASLSRATGASVGRTSGRYGIGIVGSGRIVTAALALRSGTRSRAAFREGAFAATGPVHTVRRR